MSLDDLYAALKQLSTAHGISGNESGVAARVIDLFSPLCDDVRTDSLGNVIAVKRGEQQGSEETRIRFMVAAHTDEIGFLVSGIHADGFLNIAPVGGIERSLLPAKEVWVHTLSGPLPGIIATKPPHLTTSEERQKLPRWDEFHVDVGLPPEQVKQVVRIGDMITLRGRCERLTDRRVAGKAIDDRAGVTAMYDMLRRLAALRHRVDVYAVATVQEEVGLRGAMTATFGVAPHVGVAVDVGFGHQPGVDKKRSRELGKGPIIARGANIHPQVFAGLEHTAIEMGIPHQFEVAAGDTGTDAWAMQVSRSGVPTGLLSIPITSMHSPVECVDLGDIASTGRLLASYASRLDPEEVRGWQHVFV